MADYVGTIQPSMKYAASPVVTPLLKTMTRPAFRPSLSWRVQRGVRAGNTIVRELLRNFGGTAQQSGGQELFEKIIVTPRVKGLGFVLATVTFNTNVWNTHRSLISTLTAINVKDSGNVKYQNPWGLPLRFGPGQARDFATVIPADGDATINAVTTFVFPGESGADQTLTGSRIQPFPFDPDWSDSVRESTEYLTHVMTMYNRSEQRYALRKTPRTRFKYKALTTSMRETAALDALLWSWQARMFGVPAWMDAQPLLSDAAAGVNVIAVSTQYRRFAVGGLCMLWRDWATNEALTVQSVASGSVTLTAPINNTWKADGATFVVPMLSGRLIDSLDVKRLSGELAEADLEFLCEVV